MLQREYKYERENYSIDKRIANLICDMGFAIHDQDLDSKTHELEVGATKFHRLVKRTDKHMIVVLYEIRNRLFMDEVDHESSMDLAKRTRDSTCRGRSR